MYRYVSLLVGRARRLFGLSAGEVPDEAEVPTPQESSMLIDGTPCPYRTEPERSGAYELCLTSDNTRAGEIGTLWESDRSQRVRSFLAFSQLTVFLKDGSEAPLRRIGGNALSVYRVVTDQAQQAYLALEDSASNLEVQ